MFTTLALVLLAAHADPAVSFTLPPQLVVGLIAAVVLPLLVGLVTNSNWSPGAKSILHLVLSAITGTATEFGAALTQHTTFDFGLALLTFAGVFLGGVAVHFGVSVPTGAASKLAAIGGPDVDESGDRLGGD